LFEHLVQAGASGCQNAEADGGARLCLPAAPLAFDPIYSSSQKKFAGQILRICPANFFDGGGGTNQLNILPPPLPNVMQFLRH